MATVPQYHLSWRVGEGERFGCSCLGGINPEHVQAMDAVEHIGAMRKIGAMCAKKHVNMAPFKRFIQR